MIYTCRKSIVNRSYTHLQSKQKKNQIYCSHFFPTFTQSRHYSQEKTYLIFILKFLKYRVQIEIVWSWSNDHWSMIVSLYGPQQILIQHNGIFSSSQTSLTCTQFLYFQNEIRNKNWKEYCTNTNTKLKPIKCNI